MNSRSVRVLCLYSETQTAEVLIKRCRGNVITLRRVYVSYAGKGLARREGRLLSDLIKKPDPS